MRDSKGKQPMMHLYVPRLRQTLSGVKTGVAVAVASGVEGGFTNFFGFNWRGGGLD
jgi:uncharacterized protein (DUF2062 family)